MDYADLIALARERYVSVNAMAKALGIPLATFQRYVTGARTPTFDSGQRIAEAAGVDLATAFITFATHERQSKKADSSTQDE